MDFRIWFSSHVPKRFSFFVRLLLCCFSVQMNSTLLALYFYVDHSLFSLAACVCRVKWQCGKCKLKNTLSLIQMAFVFVYLQSAFNLNLNWLSSSLSLSLSFFFFVSILFSVFAHFILYLFRRILNCTLSAHWPKPWANGLNCYLIWHLSETGCVNANYPIRYEICDVTAPN